MSKPGPLRELGGDGRQITNADPAMGQQIDRLLDSTPAQVAEVALNDGHGLRSALEFLLTGNFITTDQYNLLAQAIIDKGVVAPETDVLRMIVNRSSVSQQNIRDVLGWNKYPSEGDPQTDITL